MTQVYHLCIAEKEIPGGNNAQRNKTLERAGAIISLKYRRGPIFPDNNNYLVFWWEDAMTSVSIGISAKTEVWEEDVEIKSISL